MITFHFQERTGIGGIIYQQDSVCSTVERRHDSSETV
jgi:hypothetical protein